MSFGPGTGSIILKLLDTPYTPAQLNSAVKAGVKIEDVARVELKLWIDFCEAIGELNVNDGCIAIGRDKFFKNIARFLTNKAAVGESIRRSQICTTRAGVKAADLAGSASIEVSVEDYSKASMMIRDSVLEALKKLPKTRADDFLEAPLCDG